MSFGPFRFGSPAQKHYIELYKWYLRTLRPVHDTQRIQKSTNLEFTQRPGIFDQVWLYRAVKPL